MCEEVLMAFTSHLNGEIIQNPYNSSSSHTVKQCWGLPVNPTGHFSKFSDWWEVVVANRAAAYSVKQTAMPGQTLCQNRQSRALGLLLPNPHWEKQNNLTHPKWLFTWPCRWMSTLFFFFFFNSWAKQAAWASFLCPVEWGSTLCWYLFVYHLHSLCNY